MENRKERNGPRKVPQFGAWDNNAGDGGNGGYTVEFSKARANKQHQPENGLDARHELKNDKEFKRHEHKQGLDARHKEIKHHEHKHGLDARQGHGLKNNNNEIQHREHKYDLDAHHGHGLKNNNKEPTHQQHKNGLGTHHGLENNQEFQHQPYKNGLGARHGLTNDQEFPGNMKNGYRSVPQFGMWDQQAAGGGAAASYTVEFSKARVNRKQHKNNDLLARPPSIDHEQEDLRKQHEDACMRKKNMLTYLNCCIRP
ncbi:hypothetical protein R3W88_030656 [Solanum pinnatisectum]|uniref:RIN4 pathogenic type III effector avirulence factor Avr cleavage site domain-containing protein n=1 Tax=Solanum pinnatisectum TaxID=50273 RepID=A0AAV9LJ79_9SOLN|nr:hypothetical protein R3W88_030656 [Solanum pinnatisectum]